MSDILNNIKFLLSGKSGNMNVDSFGIYSDNGVQIDTTTVSGQREALRKSSVVQSCVILRADGFSNLNIYPKLESGKKVSSNKYTEADMRLLNSINEFQDYRTFNNMVETFAAPFGKCYIYKQKMLGLDKFRYYIIPNHLIQEKYTGLRKTSFMFESQPDYYEVSLFDGQKLRLENDEVFIYYDNTFYGEHGYGTSRLEGLGESISTLLASGEVATQVYADGGGRGIIGQGARDSDSFSDPFFNGERTRIQNDLKKYGRLRDQLKYIVTRGVASYVPLTDKVVDMDIPQISFDAALAIFRRMGIPSAYAQRESRYKSLPEARKELYTGTIVPEATTRFKQIIKMVGIPERDWEYKPDYTHLDFYQESLQQSATALLNASTALKNAVEGGFMSAQDAEGEFEYYLNR